MPVFFFEIKAIPTPAANMARDIAMAFVHAFAVGDNVEQAETLAKSNIMDYGWIPQTVITAHETTPEHIQYFQADILKQYYQACVSRVALYFVAVPKEERDPAHPVEFRSLGAPIIDNNQH